MSAQVPSKSKDLAFCGLAIALITISAWVTIPLGPVPFTLQTMMLVLVITLFNAERALYSVGGYIVLGLVGAPVFSGMRAGLATLSGPTGGFIIGFFVGTIAAVVLRRFWKQPSSMIASVARDVVSAAVFLLCCYSCGVAWFVVVTGSDAMSAIALCVAPFVLLDCIKCALAIAAAQALKASVPSLRTSIA